MTTKQMINKFFEQGKSGCHGIVNRFCKRQSADRILRDMIQKGEILLETFTAKGKDSFFKIFCPPGSIIATKYEDGKWYLSDSNYKWYSKPFDSYKQALENINK